MQIKHGIYGVVISLALSAAAWADEAPKVGCAAKLEAISAELAQAKATGNKHKVDGLEKAYYEVSTHCDDDSLYAERVAKVAALEEKLTERQNELAKAIEEGRSMDKINKKRNKVAEAELELAKARAELTQ
ncbi:DUF1090 domain-containing protein [Shewanella baltica]|uniref:DUF1090 domain-containing protein n=1 Tax=Shewanella baltica TaxID=62322 RepID=UPI003D79164F